MILFFVDWQIMFMAGILLKKTAYKDSYKKSRGFRRLFINTLTLTHFHH